MKLYMKTQFETIVAIDGGWNIRSELLNEQSTMVNEARARASMCLFGSDTTVILACRQEAFISFVLDT